MRSAIHLMCCLALACAVETTGAQVVGRTLQVNGVSTSVTDTGGDGPPIVLMHALGLDRHMWDDTISELRGRYRVIAYDVRGHGGARGVAGPFSMPLFAADLLALLDRMQIPRAHIVGLSMGGVIAQEFALQHPDRLHTLTLVATASKGLPAFRARGESALEVGMEGQIVPTLTRWFTPAALATNPTPIAYARQMILRDKVEDWRASWEAMATMQVYDRLPGLRVPTHVVAGELDVSCPPVLMYEDIAARIPGASFEIIPGASHMVSLVAPKALALAISRVVAAGPRVAAAR